MNSVYQSESCDVMISSVHMIISTRSLRLLCVPSLDEIHIYITKDRGTIFLAHSLSSLDDHSDQEKFFDKQLWWIDSVSRNQIASDTCVSLAAQKWIFYCRAPFFSLFFFGGITNDLSTTRNRSIIWRHCLCIGNGSGNIARNTGTGWCTFMSFSWPRALPA